MVERGGLENRCTARYRGFESLTLCKIDLNSTETPQILSFEGFFVSRHFILGKAPIYARVTIDGKRAEISMGQKVESERWNINTGNVKGNKEEARIVSVALENIRNKIKSIYWFRQYPKRFSETWGTKGRFNIVPLKSDRVYWFATMSAPQDNAEMRNFGVAGLRRNFQHYHAPVAEILEHTTDEQLLWNDISDFKTIENYAFDSVVLAGDAAHAMTPNLGQGAGMAIEDDAFVDRRAADEETV